MEPPSPAHAHGPLMSPSHFTAADFPSEYDNSADAFAESASYDVPPYGYRRPETRESVDVTNTMLPLDAALDSPTPMDVDATAEPTPLGKPSINSGSPRRLSIAVPQPGGLKMGPLSARRLSIDPSRYPSPNSAGTQREDVVATAAEDYDESEEELVAEDPLREVHSGLQADEDLGDEVDYGDVQVREDDEGVMARGNAESEFVPELQFERPLMGPPDDSDDDDDDERDPEEEEPAYQEEAENDWEVGLRRKEHDPEFQDAAGLDYGDAHPNKPDDDEGDDPLEDL
ncbi:hypothetical protein SpCBS45565_g05185 [Spizellomyces sp. 'palustris']|nr:hypothetical protein SpCBS45565_g05185 [Spizellomyces sp. 'palustris']